MRVAADEVVLDGLHAVKHAHRFGGDLRRVLVEDRTAARALAARLAPDLDDVLVAAEQVGPGPLEALAGPRRSATGVVALAARPAGPTRLPADRRAPAVVLEQPRHAGNVGAVVRTAAAAGASAVGVGGPLDPWSPACLRGSAGLHWALPVVRLDDVATCGRPLVALTADGDAVHPADLPDDAILAVGTERDGLSEDVLAAADLRLALPMEPGVSSLNVAASVAAVLYAWRLDRPGTGGR